MSVFWGENAQGKSNLLEAIYFISTGRSFRTNKAQEMVQWEAPWFEVRCQAEFCGVAHRLAMVVGPGQHKYLLDGKPRRGGSVFGNFKAVIFASEDLDVVRQEPGGRRRFFDLFFSQVECEYSRRLDDYQKIVQSRNRLLKEELFGQLDVWDALLVREGGWLVWRRKQLLEDFEVTARGHHQMVSAQTEALGLRYKTSCAGDSQEQIAKALAAKLEEHREHERILRVTLAGPHRDDYEIRIGDAAVRNFGSEGQKRSVMLSLRMAQWKFLAQMSGEPPMILLDDVLGELDGGRQDAFLDLVAGCGAQVFVATTQAGTFLEKKAGAIFRVCAGMVEAAGGRGARA